MLDEKYVSEIVAKVVKSMDIQDVCTKQKGVFDTMEEALEAVKKARELYREYSIEQREKIISCICKNLI